MMIDNISVKGSNGLNYLIFFIVSLTITIIFAIINNYIEGNLFFLVALVSLALSYPVTNYIKKKHRQAVFENTFRLRRYENELFLFWAIFLGVSGGFFFSSNLIEDYDTHFNFDTEIKGSFLELNENFDEILRNNLMVGFYTFLICLFVFGGLVFVLVWNASNLAYFSNYVAYDVYHFLSILPHGLLEIGGYVFAGIAGSVISANLCFGHFLFKKSFSWKAFLDAVYLCVVSVSFIFVGAIVETL